MDHAAAQEASTRAATWSRLWPELLAFLVALAFAVGAVASVVFSERGAVLFYDGDSVLLELVHRSILAGEAPHWAMSAVLFVFPEIPTYLLLRAAIPVPEGAVMVNAVLTLSVLYLLLRLIAARLTPVSIHARWAALVGSSLFALCVSLETGTERESFQLASLLIFPTYYYGAVLVFFGVLGLTLGLLRTEARRVPVMAAIAVLTALATASNALYALWGVAPIVAGALIASLLKRLPWRDAVLLMGPTLVGLALGLIARIPLGVFASPAALPYNHPGKQLDAAIYYPREAATLLLHGRRGPFEFMLLAILLAVAVVALIVVLRNRRLGPVPVITALIGVGMPIGIYLFNVVAGTESTRYLQPFYFAPLLSVLVLVVQFLERRPSLGKSPRRWLAPVVAAVAAVAVVVPAVALVNRASQPYQRADCLEEWVDGRDVTGLGQFWESRDLAAYGSPDVDLLQVQPNQYAFPWLVNLAHFYDAEPTYVVGSPAWAASVEDELGPPAERIECADYTILDYAGTDVIDVLHERAVLGARATAVQQGLIVAER
ncbi:hypothetical protein [Agromyces sp. Soil535]|uniref:hypothetical protein n=1 Tax=Agromyces sp. Soil535 TaxID=1736390 RepID=UPI000702024A|nr:hypothetical protein [Agromyces sp. Soil535]KRE22941.1 hypothetical protein ASG80_08690 [Agromyces sp. Soil535]